MLMPIGGGENVPATHKIGLLAAGEEKVLDVELTARQAGNLTIQVDARADGGVHAELAEKVIVRRAGLKLDVRRAEDAVRRRGGNLHHPRPQPRHRPGAKRQPLGRRCPPAPSTLAGIDGARLDASGSKLRWTVEAINPEVEQSFVLKCSLAPPASSRMQVGAAADDDLTASADTVTRVDAVANLVMDVKDPEGPVAVGEEATYEVLVRNRGTKEAQDVEVFAYFSRGIEPTGAEGRPNRLRPGQVTFQPHPLAGRRRRSGSQSPRRAEVAGNHIFRAEAHCKPLGTRLVSEATNLYYADSPAVEQTARAPGRAAPNLVPMRTVTRPAEGNLNPMPPRQ